MSTPLALALLTLHTLPAFALKPLACSRRLDTDAFLARAAALHVAPAPGWDDPACTPPHAQPDCKAHAEDPACFKLPATLPGEQRWTEVELEPGRPKVRMTYTIQKALHPATPPKTVVHFTGGPMPSLRLERDKIMKVPPDADLITLEWPGVGENLGVRVFDPDKAYSSAGAVRYAESVIAAEKLGVGGNRYTIYGLSYGSIIGTKTASDISHRKDIPRPVAVYLDSVVGHADYNDMGTSARDRATWDALSVNERAALKKKAAGLERLLGGTTESLDGVMRGAFETPGISPGDAVRWLAGQSDEVLLGCALASAKFRAEKGFANGYTRVGRCEFITKGVPPSTIGGLFPFAPGFECLCSDSKLRGSWNAKEHVIDGIPVLMRTGSADDLTPLPSQGQYAYDGQTCTRKVSCSDEGGTHGIYFDNPHLDCHKAGVSCDSCRDAVWSAAFHGDTGEYERAMRGCGPVTCRRAALSCGREAVEELSEPDSRDAR